MKVLEAEFLTSATEKTAGVGWPAEGPPEVAFAGRSNVGKSTLLQALMQRRGLVRISSTPGRTRLINFFRVVVAPEGGRAPADRRELLLRRSARLRLRQGVEGGAREVAALRRPVPVGAQRAQGAGACSSTRGASAGIDETEIANYVAARGVSVLAVMTKADKLTKHERKPAAGQARARARRDR